MTDFSSAEVLALAGEFPASDETTWRKLVDKVLKGAAADSLTRTTADEIQIRPLYTATDASPGAGMPGAAPFVRGASASGSAGGWDVRQFHSAVEVAATNVAILEDLEGGATSIHLRLTPELTSDVEQLLAGVLLDVAAVGLDAGAAFAPAATRLLDLAAHQGFDRALLRAELNADPLGAAIAGAELEVGPGIDAAVALALSTSTAWPGVTSLVADGRPYHAGGASEAQELAFAVATGIAYLRALSAAGCRHGRQHGRSPSRSPRMPISSSPWPSSAHCAGSGAASWRSLTHRRRCPRCASMPRPRLGCSRGSTRT